MQQELIPPLLPVYSRRHPWAEPVRDMVPANRTITEILQAMPTLPTRFWRDGAVTINDNVVKREYWNQVRPKCLSDGSISVSLWLPPLGGGTGSILKLVATVAIIVGATLISGGALTPVFGSLFAAGTLGASLAAAAFTVGASLALSALSPPPSSATLNPATASETVKQLTPASLQGNVLAPGAPIVHVRGYRKLFPPVLVKPLVELVGDDEYITGAIGLSGRHDLTDIRVAGTPIDLTDLQYETRDGNSSNSTITLVTRQSKTDAAQIQLSQHKIDPDHTDRLADQTTPTNSVPQWHAMRAVGSPDEVWINLQFPQGLFDNANPTLDQITPIRLRFRLKTSSTWIYAPEIMFAYRKQDPFQKDIRLKWTTAPALPTPGTSRCPCFAFSAVPMRVETRIGNMSNMANAFDGTASTFALLGANGYIGADFGSFPRTVKYVILSPHPDGVTGYSEGATVSFALYGKNGSAPANATDGTLLYSTGSIADTLSNLLLTSSDTTTQWRHLWISATRSSGSIYFAAINFLGDNDYSHVANSYFQSSFTTAPLFMDAGNIGSTGVRNIGLYADRADIFLDTGTFPKGDYDIEIKRGSVTQKTNWVQNGYAPTSGESLNNDGSNRNTDFFMWHINSSGFKALPRDMTGVYWEAVRQRFSLIWNTHPLPNAPGKLAIIAFKAKNRQIGQISTIAGLYVNDYNSGAGTWSTSTPTTNPAPHVRDVLAGALNSDPVPSDLLDDDSLIAFRTQCVNNGYQVNTVCEGLAAATVAQICAACGFGRVRQSETFGVLLDKDRSDEAPVQTFTARNARAYKWDKAYVRRPSGFRAVYADSSNDYQETQRIVLDPDGDSGARYEEIRYDGFISSAEVDRRALFDLKQSRLRMTFHSFEANQQAIKCKRGDLIALNHPVLSQQMGAGYIRTITTSGGNVTALTLEGTVPGSLTERLAAQIRLNTGLEIVAEIVPTATESRTLTFVSPLVGPITGLEEGCLVTTGILGAERIRLIVADITAKEGAQYPCTITAVDEAPTLWGNPTARSLIRRLGLDEDLVLCLDAGDGDSFTTGQIWTDTSGQANSFYFGTSGVT